jgi:hypothetical protein
MKLLTPERAFKDGAGWTYVDEAMQKQIEAGVTTPEAYHRHFVAAGFMASWEAYNAWKEAHPGEEVPREINTIPGPIEKVWIERYQRDSSWLEAMDRTHEKNDFGRVHKFLTDCHIYQAGVVMRAFGLAPSSNHALALILLEINSDRIGLQKRIRGGDDDLVRELLREK